MRSWSWLRGWRSRSRGESSRVQRNMPQVLPFRRMLRSTENYAVHEVSMALKTLLPFLECPHRCGPLSWSAAKLECERGHIFPIADGVTPILLTEDLADSRTIRETLSWAKHPTAEVHSKQGIHPHV